MNENKEISSLSYINKDFGAIYPEMLDLAKQLTNKWDPSQSNESDPGVVLLKEGAFVADHNNYNIDKNILEAFLPSATQDRSVRNITEMNGYTPRYYVSANGYVTFVWNQPEGDTTSDMFSVPAFTFVISDSDETVSYTQIEDLSISKSGVPSSCRFIEGTVQTLSINDMSVINLENLDDNNRLYLPETMVAQNGIYIRNTNKNDYDALWERNNYLLTQPLGSRIYKIDYDSLKMLPYIEFPTDIANIIGDGLEIKYIATSGTQGNVSANTLTKILSPSTFVDNSLEAIERSSENFSVFNAGAISNGKDPETIDEMYQSFRRVVGTFNTLVTCKDYDNEIYMLTDSNDSPLVSNVFVTDRRTDYNKSAQVISWDINNNFQRFKTLSTSKCSLNFKGRSSLAGIQGITSAPPGDMYFCTDNDELYVNTSTSSSRVNFVPQKSINLNDFAVLTQAMTPYDLVMYAFKSFVISDYNADKYWLAYENSFTPVSSSVREEIKSDIEKSKCISHTWNDPVTGDIYCFKNYAPLNVLITPYNKVTEIEKNEIVGNVYKTISEKFNLRNINFGVKLDVEEIESAIVDSDSRIRRVDILPIQYTTKAMLPDGKEEPFTEDIIAELITKNVLAGRVCLFDFNEDFKYDYGQTDGQIFSYDVDHQSTVKTELYIPLTTSSDDYATHENTGEKLTSTTQYKSSGSNYMYEFTLGAGEDASQTVYNGLSYTLKDGDKFILYELDANGKISKTITWTKGVDIDISIVNRLDDGSNISTTATKTALSATGDILIEKEINIKSVESDVVNLDYTLNKNESIQIIYPNYYSDTTYSVYVNYRYESSDPTSVIKANTDHTLEAGEKIILVYSKDGSPFTALLNPGDVINASFDLIPTDVSGTVGVSKTWTDINGVSKTNVFKTLSSNQTISKRKLMTTELRNTGIWCYWIINSDKDNKNTLFSDGTRERILRNNEYFIYTNSSLNELLILGAGTKLELKGSVTDFNQWSIDSENTLTIESISNEGVSSSVPWRKNIDFTKTPVYITEMNVITLGETDRIKIVGWSSDLMPRVGSSRAFNILGYDASTGSLTEDAFSICDGSITYTINGSSVTLPKVNNFYSIKSRLDLNVGPGVEQQLFTTTDESGSNLISAQRVYFRENGRDILVSAENKDNCYIQSSEYCVGIGNIVNLTDDTKFFAYSKDGKSYARGIKLPTGSDDGEVRTKQYTFFCNSLSDKEAYMIPVHITGSRKPIKAKFSGSKKEGSDTTEIELLIKDYNTRNSEGALIQATEELVLQGDSSYYLVPVAPQGTAASNYEITLTLSWTGKVSDGNEVLTVEDLVVINGLNPELSNIEGCDLQRILKEMSNLIANSDVPSTKPYYPYKLDNSIAMDVTDFKDSYAMWDKNNIANKMTVAQIDLQGSVIEIVKDMRNGDY